MGINISEIVQGKKWKNFMKYLYGWGAAVVLAGALFKLQHWPFAGEMLTIGMTVEVIIFFFSAFEPIHEEVDWTLVYPELAMMDDEEEIRNYRKNSEGLNADSLKEILASVSGGGAPAGAQGALVFSDKFNKMLETADFSPELFQKVSQGLNKLSDTSAKLADISDAATATNQFTDRMKKATETVAGFSDSYQQSGQVLNESVIILSDSFQKTAGTVAESGQNFMSGVGRSVGNLEDSLTKAGETVSQRITQSGNDVASQISSAANNLTATYSQLADSMRASGEIINQGSSGYHQQLEKLNKSMAALNAAHELHLQGTTERLKQSEGVYSGVEGMIKKLNVSVSETEKFTEALGLLNRNISSLNTVYGNMLSAMNVMSNGK
jgi:gliding motility-associated protein GldL